MATEKESVDGRYYIDSVFIPEDSDDGFEYEEILLEDYIVTEGEESLEAAVKAHREHLDDSEPARSATAGQPLARVPELVDDFLRNFLVSMGMNRTLDCFHTEWFEMLQKGRLNTDAVGLVPDAYTHNQLLQDELRKVQKERDGYKEATFRARQTVVKLQKQRDFHRLRHVRVVQEKNKLIEDIKQLKKHCASYEPALKELNEKYQAALKQKMLLSIERDRAYGQINNPDSTLLHSPSSPGTRKALRDTECQKQQKVQRNLERITREPFEGVAPYNPSKDPTKNTACKHLKDSEFPTSTRINPLLPQLNSQCAPSSKMFGLSLTKSLKAHSMAVSFLALHPHKLVVASASDDHLWRLWGLPEGEMIMTGEGHTDWLSSCSFHPRGDCLATTSGDTTLRIWDFARGCCVLTFVGHTHATWGCAFHSCGDFVASCSMDNTAKVWDLNSERCRYTLRGHVDSVNSVAFLPFSNVLLTSSADKTLCLWDTRAGLCTQTFYGHQHSCNSAAFNVQGDMVASCDSYGVVKLWDMRNVSATATMNTGPHPSNQVAFNPNGQVLAVASNDGSVKLVEIASLHMSSLSGHGDAVQSVIFDHKGAYVLSAGYNGEIFLWS